MAGRRAGPDILAAAKRAGDEKALRLRSRTVVSRCSNRKQCRWAEFDNKRNEDNGSVIIMFVVSLPMCAR